MANNIDLQLSRKYNPRFGEIALRKGYATPEQIKRALQRQLADELANRPHRLIGRIMLDNGWMTGPQIEEVMSELFTFKKENNGFVCEMQAAP